MGGMAGLGLAMPVHYIALGRRGPLAASSEDDMVSTGKRQRWKRKNATTSTGSWCAILAQSFNLVDHDAGAEESQV